MKYRILEDQKSKYEFCRFIPQVYKDEKWVDLERLCIMDTAKRVIKAHQFTGTRYVVVWDSEAPEQKNILVEKNNNYIMGKVTIMPTKKQLRDEERRVRKLRKQGWNEHQIKSWRRGWRMVGQNR